MVDELISPECFTSSALAWYQLRTHYIETIIYKKGRPLSHLWTHCFLLIFFIIQTWKHFYKVCILKDPFFLIWFLNYCLIWYTLTLLLPSEFPEFLERVEKLNQISKTLFKHYYLYIECWNVLYNFLKTVQQKGRKDVTNWFILASSDMFMYFTISIF